MKTNKETINNYTVLSLLVVYIFVVLVFIPFLPKINNGSFRSTSTINAELFHKNTNSGTTGLIVQRGIKSIIENKRKVTLPATVVLVLSFFLVFGALILKGSKTQNSTYTVLSNTPHSYLSLRTLRI